MKHKIEILLEAGELERCWKVLHKNGFTRIRRDTIWVKLKKRLKFW